MTSGEWTPDLLGPELRTVLIGGPLDVAAANEAAARLLALDGMSGDPVTLVVNSPGGELAEVTALLDVLDLLRAPVELAVAGRAHGTAGVLVAGAPGRRTAGPRATLSLRCTPEAERTGSVTDVVRHAEMLEAVKAGVVERLAGRTGRPEPWVADQMDRGGVLRADDAVAAGLLDAVSLPPRLG